MSPVHRLARLFILLALSLVVTGIVVYVASAYMIVYNIDAAIWFFIMPGLVIAALAVRFAWRRKSAQQASARRSSNDA
jgi:hypothetical protein